jgi:Pyruvate/2-oxoacid:ferredoxin oxidoreductase delta subunit
MKVRIDYAICNSCGLCREVCPAAGALVQYEVAV